MKVTVGAAAVIYRTKWCTLVHYRKSISCSVRFFQVHTGGARTSTIENVEFRSAFATALPVAPEVKELSNKPLQAASSLFHRHFYAVIVMV
jgi:hypothetical protein